MKVSDFDKKFNSGEGIIDALDLAKARRPSRRKPPKAVEMSKRIKNI